MLNLTRQEILVIQFLVGFFLLGTAIHLYRSCHEKSPAMQERQASQPDAEFKALARQMDSVPAGERQTEQTASAAKVIPAGKINLNTAGKDELMRLTGIGPTIAERIILYREDVHSFRKVEDLLGVKGIGEITLERIKDEVTIE